jgi:hypothetical protein
MTRSSGSEPSPGINLNAGPESDPSKVADADVTFEPANPLNDPANETLQIDGDFGGDTISAAGGPGFDGPLKPAITLFGGPGNDRLTGGAGSDTLYADAGDDVLDGGNNFDIATFETSPNAVNLDLGNAQPQDTGALGKDQLSHVESLKGSQYDDVLTGNDGANGLFGGAGNDLLTGRGGAGDGIDGGPGTDTASYRLPPAGETRGVTVDLGKDVSQQTTGAGFDTLTSIENLWGSPFADVLTGDTGPNTLVGWQGSDSLSGKEGADVMAVRDGTADQVTCGPGADQVIADTQGTDSIFSDCEMVDFAPFVPPPPGSDPGTSPPPGTDPGTSPPPPPATDTVAPLLDRLGLKPASFSLKARRVGKRLRRGGTEISYRLSETAAVTFGVQRAAVGRRKGRRCVAVTSKNRGGRACRRWTGVRGALLHAGLPALNRLHFAGRIGGRPLGPGRYRLTAVARDGAGNRSVRRLAGFSVLR